MLRVVLDTNVLVSALLSSEGIPNQVLRQAKQNYQLFTSHEILEEARDALLKPRIQRKIMLPENKIQAFLFSIQRIAVIVENLPSLKIIEDDPDDNMILACAIKIKADYLVSGDTHLRKLGSYKGIQIISLTEFLAILPK